MKKVMKKTVALALAMSMVFSTVVVSNAAKKKAGKVAIKTTGVSVAKKTITIGKKKTVKLTVAAKKPTVKASKKGIVTVKKSGKTLTVKGKKVGKTTLTIKKKGYKNVKVTVKVAKKAPAAIKVATADVKAGATVDFKVTTKAKKIAAKSANKKVATVTVAGKTLKVTGVSVATTNLYVYDKANAANFKTVKVAVAENVEEVKGEVSADGTSISYKLPDLKTVKSATTTIGKVKVALSEAEAAEVIAAVQKNDVAALINTKAAKAGDDVKFAGVTAKVKTAANKDGKAVVTYGNKDYSVVADNAKKTVTVNATTFTYDDKANTVTVKGDKAKIAKYKDVKVDFTLK